MKIINFIKKTAKQGFAKKTVKIIKTVKKENLSYISNTALHSLYKHVKKTNKLNGIIIEAGCALGGSAIVIANAKSANKKFYIFDVFGMIPPPNQNVDGNDIMDRYEKIKIGQAKGIGNDPYYGYKDDLLNEVKNNFTKCGVDIDDNIVFVKGLYQDTLSIKEPVSLAHIDCDWYDSVMICLNQIVPNLVVGGRIVVDDYNYWSGCKKAVDKFFSDEKINSKYKLTNGEKQLIIKTDN
jgi:asparagine synthase (glutamine-hydrolysing)